jgi:hypothetical protein
MEALALPAPFLRAAAEAEMLLAVMRLERRRPVMVAPDWRATSRAVRFSTLAEDRQDFMVIHLRVRAAALAAGVTVEAFRPAEPTGRQIGVAAAAVLAKLRTAARAVRAL